MRVAAIMSCAVLAACSIYPTDWARPGASANDLRREAAQCRLHANESPAVLMGGIAAPAAAASVYEDCMLAKGWIKAQ